MHINDLPSELVVLCIRKLVDNRPSRTEEWVCRLRILTVCRKWRILALPLICKHIYIDCLAYSNNCCSSEVSSHENPQSLYTTIIKSNLDFVMMHKQYRYPRIFKIWIECFEPPFSQLDLVLDMLKGYALALQGVTELDIEAITYMQETNSSLEIEANDYKSEQRIAKEFVQLIPNVTRLNCLPIAATTHLRYMTFSKEIAKYYAPQLSMINSNPAGLQLVTRFSENLSSVALTIHDSSIIPESSIIPALLKNLHIINALDSSYWRAFVDYLGSTRITFRNLKKLAIDSSVGSRQLFQGDTAIWREQDYICPYKISAPALKQLQVDLCPPSYALAMSISLPERLETLVITVGCNIRLNLLKVQTGKVLNKLFSKDTLPSGVFNDEVLFANRVLNTPNLAKKISITIYTTREKIPTDIISWNRLSCLTIVRRINFANLLVLIGKLPNLSELNAEAVECIARKGNFVLPSLAMIRNDEYTPLNTKIISASLKCMVYGTTQDNPADTITEYLKARIATLKHVYISAY